MGDLPEQGSVAWKPTEAEIQSMALAMAEEEYRLTNYRPTTAIEGVIQLARLRCFARAAFRALRHKEQEPDSTPPKGGGE
jgi:hypothetical protein